MVDSGWFVSHEDSIGMEVELDLVDPLGRPRLVNDAVLNRLGRADLQQELGQFNIEANLVPRRLTGSVLADCERELARTMAACSAAVAALGTRLVAIVLLPTLSAEPLTMERISPTPRYVLRAGGRGGVGPRRFAVQIDGAEPVAFRTDSLVPEAAATSLQLHLLVPPDRFAGYYN